MNAHEAMEVVAQGGTVTRPGGPVLYLQRGTPVIFGGSPPIQFLKFLCVTSENHDEVPFALSRADLAAQDWADIS